MNDGLSFVIITSPNDSEVEYAIESVAGLGNIYLIDGGHRLNLNKPAYDYNLIRKLATKYGAEYFYFPYKYSAMSYNFGIDKVRSGYIFILDSDERIDSDMRTWLELGKYREYPVYNVKRLNYFTGKPVKHGHLGPDWNIRLFRYDVARYEDRTVHARVVTSAKPKKATGLLIHDSNPTVDSFFLKMIDYSKREIDARSGLASSNESKAKVKTIIQRLPNQGLIKFVYSYIWKKGFLDGRQGFDLAISAAFYELLVVFRKHFK